MYQSIRRFLLDQTEREGRVRGAKQITFNEKMIIQAGEDVYVAGGILREFLFKATAFYLSVPGNAFCIVTLPDGAPQLFEGGLHEVPPGTYKPFYIDRAERRLTTAPVSELTKDNEKLALSVLVRYRVADDPREIFKIDKPLEMMVEHIQTDIAQYIRTHNHDEIADKPGENKVLAFFIKRHNSRHQLARAIVLTGVELKEFSGDMEWVEMRRGDSINKKLSEIDKEKLERQSVIEKLQTAYKVEMDRMQAKHRSELEATLSKADAEKEALKSDILYKSQLREIHNELMRRRPEQRREYVGSAMEAIRQALEPSAFPRNNPEINGIITALLATIREDMQEAPDLTNGGSVEKEPQVDARSAREKKIGDLTSTLLEWLEVKK